MKFPAIIAFSLAALPHFGVVASGVDDGLGSRAEVSSRRLSTYMSTLGFTVSKTESGTYITKSGKGYFFPRHKFSLGAHGVLFPHFPRRSTTPSRFSAGILAGESFLE